jgi:hypothetical protein
MVAEHASSHDRDATVLKEGRPLNVAQQTIVIVPNHDCLHPSFSSPVAIIRPYLISQTALIRHGLNPLQDSHPRTFVRPCPVT